MLDLCDSMNYLVKGSKDLWMFSHLYVHSHLAIVQLGHNCIYLQIRFYFMYKCVLVAI